jgi:hypothetical protein
MKMNAHSATQKGLPKSREKHKVVLSEDICKYMLLIGFSVIHLVLAALLNSL